MSTGGSVVSGETPLLSGCVLFYIFDPVTTVVSVWVKVIIFNSQLIV